MSGPAVRSSCSDLLNLTPGNLCYLKLKFLIVKGGTRVLRELLDFIISPETLSVVINRPHVIARLPRRHFCVYQWELLYPPLGPCQPEQFDLTLLFKLLRQHVISNLNPPSTGWSELPSNADLSLEADIVRIHFYRNFASHLTDTTMDIPQRDFVDYWNEVKDTILRIVRYYSPNASPFVREWETSIDDLLARPLEAIRDQEGSSFLDHLRGNLAQVFSLRCVIKLASTGAWLGGTIYVLNKLNIPDVLANLVESSFPDGISVFRTEFGSIKLQLWARDLLAMEKLRNRYDSGQLKNDLEKFMITEELKHLANGEPVEFSVEMDEDEYLLARQYLYGNQETTDDEQCITVTAQVESDTVSLEEEDEKTAKEETATTELTAFGKSKHNIEPSFWNFVGISSKMSAKTSKDRFRVLLLDLANELTTEELEKLKFLCKGVIPGAALSRITNTLQLFEKLMQEGKLSRENIGYLRDLLTNIHREDLKINQLQKYIVDISGAQTYGLVKQSNVIGRDALLEKVIKVYTTGQKPMVAVVAPPGFGKTCFATKVGHAMKHNGYKVIYVSLQQNPSCYSMCCEILRTIDPEIPFSDDVIQQTKNRLKSKNHPTLLILDNAEDIQNSPSSDDFQSFVEFLGSNEENLKIFLGSRKSMYTKCFEHESINLPPLDDEASLELLLALANGTSLNHHEAEELALQCAGVPLLIKIAASLVNNGYNPTKLADNLREKLYDVLNLTDNDLMEFLTNAILVFLDSLSREKLVALVKLSCFPAQFTEDIANELMFEDEVKCSGMMASLYASALVQLDGRNYSLHPLIQTFCREEQERMNCKTEGIKAIEKFSYYYFEELEKLHRQFVSKDGCQKALKQFHYSKMNLLQALENALKCKDAKMKLRCIDAFNASINLLGKIMLPSHCLEVYCQLYDEAEKMKDKKRMSECLVSRGFRYMCDVNHGEFSQDAFDAFETALSLFEIQQQYTEAYAHCLSKLGLCYIFKGETEQGRKLIKDAIPIRDRLGNKVLLAASHCDKAIAARFHDDHAQAIQIFENQCLPVYKEYLGDHPWVASLLDYMSKSHQHLGCLEKAIEYNNQSLDIREKLLGDHQDTARSYFRCGVLLVEQKNMEDALEAYRKAASIQEKVLGMHEETQKSYQAIYDVLHQLIINMKEEQQKVGEQAEFCRTELNERRRSNKQISEDIKRRANSVSVFSGINMTYLAVVIVLVAVLISWCIRYV